MHNGAPTDGEPRYVLGPYVAGAHAGDDIPFTTVWCHAPCEVLGGDRDGRPVDLATGSENGVPWLRDYRTIAAGESGSLDVAWRAEGVWSGNSSGGSYGLTFLGQTTVQPTPVSITIHAPAGQSIVWTSEPMDVEGASATWSGAPSADTKLQVRFEPPWALRVVRDVTRPLRGGA
jgi:hypothetical protein